MKKIVALFVSRRKNGNTVSFVKAILGYLPKDECDIEYIFPQDFKISPCIGCGNCFEQIQCIAKDELYILQKKILDSDLLIVASPVYLHYMSADLKLILDKCSWWTHTLRLQGKPTVVLSTCDSNGHRTVIEPLSKIITYMGGNVIATSNASQYPERLNNNTWLNSVSIEISQRIIRYLYLPPQSNVFLEEYFLQLKKNMKLKSQFFDERKIENGEVNYWKNSGMLEYENFSDYLLDIAKVKVTKKECIKQF